MAFAGDANKCQADEKVLLLIISVEDPGFLVMDLLFRCLGKEGHLNFRGLAVVKGEPGRLALLGNREIRCEIQGFRQP